MSTNFYKSPRNEITERMEFREQKEKGIETIPEFINDLKRLRLD